MGGPLHAGEIPVDESLVRRLTAASRPEWAALDVEPSASSGSTNALFRLGADLLVRLPRLVGGSAAIDKEALWLPRLAPHLPVAVPEVVMVGEPAFGYPERWSVVRWIDGEVAAGGGGDDLARDLADLVTALQMAEVPADASADLSLQWYRGEPLALFDPVVRAAFEACRAIPDLDVDLDRALAVWRDAMTLPGADNRPAPRWYHGDLLAENILLKDGRLEAALDFGGLGVGDPTVDLIVAWELLDPAARTTFRDAVGVDEATWLRGRAWALGLAVNTFPYYWHSMPARCATRRSIVRAVLADFD
ncbi:MAG TPA: aminoglycoside phosphotransferase family protein [Mycobacteriales bacterium]|nr:aminoglycoside phosphotransferase family protein [Mycobacteriales bacterium]